MTPDTSQLVATRDKLNKDIDALLAAASVSTPAVTQAQIDTITNEATVLDTDVVAATPTPAPVLDFAKFNASLAKLNSDAAAFVADANVKQSDIDTLAGNIDTLDSAVVAATV
jgi:hypothetical protein